MMLTAQEIIEINKGILQEWIEKNPDAQEGIAANRPLLEEIIDEVKKQDTLILKTAHLIAQIAWAQPFSGGNKRTGIVSADTMLRMSGYRLAIEDKKDIEYLRKLLFEIQEQRSALNSETLAKMFFM